MDAPIFTELLTVLPDWATQLSRFVTGNVSAIAPIDPALPDPHTKRADKKASRIALNSQQAQVTQATTTLLGPSPPRPESNPAQQRQSKLDAKPGQSRAKFSAITGPEIMYDGESQKALFECWTTLNAKRGVLRRELMAMRRKKVLTLPKDTYGYSSEEESEEEVEKKEETPEEVARRREEEARKEREERERAEREKKQSVVLEFIDSCLDRAAKACENAAYLWLKGEKDPGHMVWISARMMEAVERIRRERQPPEEKKLVVDDGVDEGFDDEMESDEKDGEESDEELPHKIPGRMQMQFRRAGERGLRL